MIESYAIVNDEGIVINVIAIDTDLHPDEQAVDDFIKSGMGNQFRARKSGTYKGFRFNAAQIGGRYIEEADAFVHNRPSVFPSFVLNTKTYQWESAVPKPSMPFNIPYITLDDKEKEDDINTAWAWEWHEDDLSWKFKNYFDLKDFLSGSQLEAIENFIASIPDVR